MTIPRATTQPTRRVVTAQGKGIAPSWSCNQFHNLSAMRLSHGSRHQNLFFRTSWRALWSTVTSLNPVTKLHPVRLERAKTYARGAVAPGKLAQTHVLTATELGRL